MDANPFPEPPEGAALRDAQAGSVMNADLRKVMRRDHAELSRERLSEGLATESLPGDGGMSRAGGIHREVPRGSIPTGPERNAVWHRSANSCIVRAGKSAWPGGSARFHARRDLWLKAGHCSGRRALADLGAACKKN